MTTHTTKKRFTSTQNYVDKLSEEYSKLNIIRVDLAYKKPHSENVSLAEANRDIEHMLNNRRSKPAIFEHQVGYIMKREYTEDKGVHIHGVFFFDGQKVQKDAYKADQIGRYWNEQITQEKGSYFNCNRKEYKRRGIGMLDYKDSEKRKILDEDVLSYLCKDEQDITPIKENKKDKAFTRGIAPSKSNREKLGRPRSE